MCPSTPTAVPALLATRVESACTIFYPNMLRPAAFSWGATVRLLEGLTKPRPGHWVESGRLYDEAAKALCSGALGRGKELIEHAMAEEQKAFEQLTSQPCLTPGTHHLSNLCLSSSRCDLGLFVILGHR